MVLCVCFDFIVHLTYFFHIIFGFIFCFSLLDFKSIWSELYGEAHYTIDGYMVVCIRVYDVAMLVFELYLASSITH